MELYTELASNDVDQRLKAANELIRKVVAASKSTEPAEQGLDLEYALKRLVKGLSSDRESARLGFSIALTELLRELDEISVRHVMEDVLVYCTPTGNVSGAEERGFLFGRLFGLTALIQSDALTRPSTTTATITDTVDELIKLATKKSWLREPVATALCNLTSKLPDHPDGKHIAEKILEGLEKNSLRQTLDGVAIAMRISALPKIRRPKLSSTAKRLWNDLDPLHHSNAQILTRLLKDVPDETGNENKQTGSSTGDLHFVWRLILERYLTPSKKLYKVKDLWQNVVENGYFAENSTLQKKYRGFQIFMLFLTQLSEQDVGYIFTSNFLRSLINHAQSDDRYLNKAAKKALSMIVPACKERPKITKWIVPCITRFSTNFDRLSKTHIVEELYGTLPLPDVDGVDGVWWELRRAYFDSSTSAERKQVADQTLFLIRTMQLNPLLKQMMEVRKYTVGMVLDFFIKSGFLVDGSVWGGRNLAEKKPLSEADHTLLREKLFSALSFLISDPDIVWASYAVQKLHDSRVLEKGVVKLDKHVQKIWNEGYTTMDNLRRRREEGEEGQSRDLEMLLALCLLQVCNGDAEAASMLEELQRSYEMRVDGMEGESTDILVEIILGLLSKPSALQRKLSEQFFGSFVKRMTGTGLKLLLDVVLTAESSSGAKELFENQEEEIEEEEGEEEHEGEEEEEAEERQEDNQEEEEEEDEEDVEMDDEQDSVNEADEKLDASLAALLGTSKEPQENDEDQEGEYSSEEEPMNDDEMMAMDDQLVTIFRERFSRENRSTKKEAKETKQQITTFKCKVIDLLEIVVKENIDISLEMILPLLHGLRLTKNDTVHSKIIALLGKLAKSKQLPNVPENKLVSLLRKIHDDAAKSTGRDGNIHSQLSILIARIARTKGLEDQIIEVYCETMRKWIRNGKSKVRARLFADWVNWCQSIRR